MKYIWQYLESEPKTIFAGLRCFLFWFAACVLYMHFIVLNNCRVIGFRPVNFWAILLFVYIALVEEAFNRAMPFFLVYIFTEEKKKYFKPFIIFALIFFSAALFGFLHQYHFINILYKGVGGLILGIVYLKFGGIRGKIIKPYLICAAVHWIYNILMTSLIYVKISG